MYIFTVAKEIKETKNEKNKGISIFYPKYALSKFIKQFTIMIGILINIASPIYLFK